MEESGEGIPSLALGRHQIVDGLGDAVMFRHSGALIQQPGVQFLDQRSGSFLPHGKAGICAGAIDLALDIEDRVDPPCVREVVRCFTFALFLRWAG